jgi:hypothetical protein
MGALEPRVLALPIAGQGSAASRAFRGAPMETSVLHARPTKIVRRMPDVLPMHASRTTFCVTRIETAVQVACVLQDLSVPSEVAYARRPNSVISIASLVICLFREEENIRRLL